MLCAEFRPLCLEPDLEPGLELEAFFGGVKIVFLSARVIELHSAVCHIDWEKNRRNYIINRDTKITQFLALLQENMFKKIVVQCHLY